MACVNRDEFLRAVQQLTMQRLGRQLDSATVTHANRDGVFSPSEWWYDAEETERHGLRTGASVSLSGNVILLKLNYEIVTI